LVVVLVLVGGVELLPLVAVGDEVDGVTALEAAPRKSPPLLFGTCAKLRTLSPAGRSRRQGCSRTVHQKLHTRRTKQTPKQMSQ
jgi:hypothetical protein